MFRGVLTGVENPTPRGGSGFGGHGKPPQCGVWAVGQDLPVGRGQGGSLGRACHLSPPPDRAGCGLPGEEDLCTHTGIGARGRELRPRQAESTGRARLPPRSHTWGSSKFWAKWGQTGGPRSRQPARVPRPRLWPPWAATGSHFSGTVPSPSLGSNTLPVRAGHSGPRLFDPPLAPSIRLPQEAEASGEGQVSPSALPHLSLHWPRARHTCSRQRGTHRVYSTCRVTDQGTQCAGPPTSRPQPTGPFLVFVRSTSRSLVPRMGVTHADQPERSGSWKGAPSVTARCLCVPGQLVLNCPHGHTSLATSPTAR